MRDPGRRAPGVPSFPILAAVCLLLIAAPVQAQGPARSDDDVAVVQQICRQYAAAQHALAYRTMYAQCMYARGVRLPGFSPSPGSPGYQGELPGPPLHNGGA